MYPKTFDDLIYEFQKLPGVGAKTAERYAFTVLGWSDEEISELAETLVNLKKKVKKCTRCGNLTENEKVISCDFIKETVAKYFSINKDDLSGNKRSNDIAFPRQIAMYLCREVANMSYPQIGTDFGGRDHSTVMHACRKIEKEVKEKNNTKLIVDSVKNIIINGKQ